MTNRQKNMASAAMSGSSSYKGGEEVRDECWWSRLMSDGERTFWKGSGGVMEVGAVDRGALGSTIDKSL